jgi:hypothetical protein
MLMGNDDKFADRASLERIWAQLQKHNWPEVAITNYQELASGRVFRRICNTGIVGSGPEIAANNYRNFSFVSGILLDRELAHKHVTDKWDGSEMYQMFVGTRMIAAGGRLLGIAEVLVGKDIQIPGESVDSYAGKPVLKKCRIEERRLPLRQYGQVAFDAVLPFIKTTDGDVFARRIYYQLIAFTYPPWIFEYRRIQSWRYAVGIALGMRPKNLLEGINLGWKTKLYLCALYSCFTFAGLFCPMPLFEKLKTQLYTFAKQQ